MHAKIFAVYAAMLALVLGAVLTRPIKATFQPPPPCELSFAPDANVTYSATLDTAEFSVAVTCSDHNGLNQCWQNCCASLWYKQDPITHTWHAISNPVCENGPALVCGETDTYDMGVADLKADYGPGQYQVYVSIQQGTCTHPNFTLFSIGKQFTVP